MAKRSRKSAAKKSSKKEKADPKTTGPADEKVGQPAKSAPAKKARAKVSGKDHPANEAIPREHLVPRTGAELVADNITESPSVTGDKTAIVFDILQKRPVEVFLIEGLNLNPERDNRLIFVQGDVSTGLMTAEGAKSKFAVLPDGTAVYNARGFDDVPGGREFDFLDIAALIESKN